MSDRSPSIQYDRLRAAILDGTYPPGSVLQAAPISRELGVSRTPIREALGRLAQEGFVEHVARGYRVRLNSPDELLDVFDARIALESAAARLAAQRRTPDDLAELDRLTKALEFEDETPAQDSLNSLWHHSVIDAAHNVTLATMVEHTRSRLAIHRLIIRSRRNVDTARQERLEHRAIVEAIRAGDSTAAFELMAAHLERGRHMPVLDVEADPVA